MTLKGTVFLLFAALLFALATVFLKLSLAAPYSVQPIVATFGRFFIGFCMFAVPIAVKRESLKANNFRMVSFRAVMNTFAVILFFAGIKFTTVTKANILNLTYPAFVFLLAPYIAHERQRLHHYVYLILTLAGAGLIVAGGDTAGFGRVNTGDLLALASGIVAGFAISGLREARKYDSARIILFYQMAFGSLLTFFLMYQSFSMPKGMGLIYVLITGVLSNLGQYFLTEGYRFISAALGSVVMESSVLFAALFGIGFLHDPVTPYIVTGGILILISIAGASDVFRRTKEQQ